MPPDHGRIALQGRASDGYDALGEHAAELNLVHRPRARGSAVSGSEVAGQEGGGEAACRAASMRHMDIKGASGGRCIWLSCVACGVACLHGSGTGER